MSRIDKPLKTLWFINGIIIFLLVCIAIFQLIMDLIPDNYERVNNDLIMGEQLNEAKEKGLALQGLHYSEPEDIYSVSAMYLEISTKTYQESKVLGLAYSSSNNLSHSFYGSLNIIFIDAEYQVIRTLVDRKADIRSWEFAKPGIGFRNQIDASVQHAAYEIAFEDTNQDGYLNEKDYHDLYISGLLGDNLTRVTEGIEIKNFSFQNDNSELFIIYYERSDARQEHKRKKFAIYDIQSGKLQLLSDLDKAITDLENQLVN